MWNQHGLKILYQQGYLMETVSEHEIQTVLWCLLGNTLVILAIYLTPRSLTSHSLQREEIYLRIEFKVITIFSSSLTLEEPAHRE